MGRLLSCGSKLSGGILILRTNHSPHPQARLTHPLMGPPVGLKVTTLTPTPTQDLSKLWKVEVPQ